MTSNKCAICKSEEFSTRGVHETKDAFYAECKICGAYIVERAFHDEMGHGVDQNIRFLISAVVREANENGNRAVEITYDSYKSLILGREINDIGVKALFFLRLINSKTEYFGQPVSIRINYDFPLIFAKNSQEFVALREYLVKAEYIKWHSSTSEDNKLSITVQGLQYLKENQNKGRDSKQAFVAMWFDQQLSCIFENGIEPACKSCGYNAFRIDRLEHNQKIDDLIIGSINDSKFLIADFTGHRPSVYFEAGYALGQKKEVIWLCKDSDINNSHFDTRQYNHVIWSNEADLRSRLETRIAAVIGRNNCDQDP